MSLSLLDLSICTKDLFSSPLNIDEPLTLTKVSDKEDVLTYQWNIAEKENKLNKNKTAELVEFFKNPIKRRATKISAISITI